MVNIYAVNISDEIDNRLFKYLMSFLSEDKQDRIKKFHKKEDMKRVLIADILVRTIICTNLKIKNKNIYFSKNKYGKPFLKHFDNFHFNISHSGQWVVCATHQSPIGIDVECIQSIDFDIAKRFFSYDEFIDLLKINENLRLSYFYELWTLKESYIKAVGKGLSIPLDSFSIKIQDNNITFKANKELKNYYFKQYFIHNDYKTAVCSTINKFPRNVIIKNLVEIFEETLLM